MHHTRCINKINAIISLLCLYCCLSLYPNIMHAPLGEKWTEIMHCQLIYLKSYSKMNTFQRVNWQTFPLHACVSHTRPVSDWRRLPHVMFNLQDMLHVARMHARETNTSRIITHTYVALACSIEQKRSIELFRGGSWCVHGLVLCGIKRVELV